ncbi:hypothetical protein GLOIN_2v1739019 [Rhizophagus irregularis DAOM 181602=DAOM 197198]|uniref:Uncharacterized protein n=1 Tax=Rhizophagus irregularis (strain DAOM 181602 / DAOM 197198 / MUCL 43194) TaxID=747089 RepID=A0A2P4NVT5_RHIID|nr:hypothetical protein GLOIN_2v1739019 [Rhizophagus irregularis DAOM 181602=DAOM 197198]POG57262.1 hypothetical protein GLOIN_2v1739019 [Rhizophagus irregularis DAOM 181602=DAOM 197198]|eukprot:XP_025164403.1 hypothetical protein GLOIN_2v1739019 [Rhizophagus irregularis DAOM 181602=DAOM 197198]
MDNTWSGFFIPCIKNGIIKNLIPSLVDVLAFFFLNIYSVIRYTFSFNFIYIKFGRN